MSKLALRIEDALAAYGGRITRFFNNLQTFRPNPPEGAQITFASYSGNRLVVTYAERRAS